MAKIISIFFVSLFLFFLISPGAYANPCTGGRIIGLVPCGLDASCPCEISDFFGMLAIIYNFIVWYIVTPLAVFMLTIGAVMILISGGNPNLANWGKRILWISIIGLALVFCSWLIIDFILRAMGYKNIGSWNQSPF